MTAWVLSIQEVLPLLPAEHTGPSKGLIRHGFNFSLSLGPLIWHAPFGVLPSKRVTQILTWPSPWCGFTSAMLKAWPQHSTPAPSNTTLCDERTVLWFHCPTQEHPTQEPLATLSYLVLEMWLLHLRNYIFILFHWTTIIFSGHIVENVVHDSGFLDHILTHVELNVLNKYAIPIL